VAEAAAVVESTQPVGANAATEFAPYEFGLLVTMLSLAMANRTQLRPSPGAAFRAAFWVEHHKDRW
jgi:hypothetical protein